MEERTEEVRLKTDSLEFNANSRGVTFSCKAYGDSVQEIQDKLTPLILYAEELKRRYETNGTIKEKVMA